LNRSLSDNHLLQKANLSKFEPDSQAGKFFRKQEEILLKNTPVLTKFGVGCPQIFIAFLLYLTRTENSLAISIYQYAGYESWVIRSDQACCNSAQRPMCQVVQICPRKQNTNDQRVAKTLVANSDL
jgi:hypothetical protein